MFLTRGAAGGPFAASGNGLTNANAFPPVGPGYLAIGGTPTYRNIGSFLPFNIDKVYLSMLLDLAYTRSSTTGSTSFFNTASSSQFNDEKIFFRKAGQPGKLYMKNSAGNDEEIQKGSAAYMKLTQAGNCYTTGFVGTVGGKKLCPIS